MTQADDTKTGIVLPFPRPVAGAACFVIIYGRELGRRWMLERSSLVIGRGESCDIFIDMDNVSRRHCEIRTMPEGGHVIEDLHSTNGTFVNSDEVTSPRVLRSGDLVKVGGTIFKYLDGESVESQFHEEIYRMTIVDGLTQVYNKRYLLEFLEREMSRCQRYGRLLSIAMIDIDRFKRVNDTYGHIAGDHVIREIAACIRARVRKEQCLARYGGEEFALVMPETEPEKVQMFAEKLRGLVEGLRITFEDAVIPVTISLGVARMAPHMTDTSMFIEAADEKLYEAKRAGRNRVVSA